MVKRLTGDYAAEIRRLRLLSLDTDPESFGSTPEYENQYSLGYFQRRLEANPESKLFGYWGIGTEQSLQAYVQLSQKSFPKMRHLADLFELYVVPNSRRQGLGNEILSHLIDLNRNLGLVEQFRLKVTSSNIAALNLYKNLGFKQIATLPKSIKYQGMYLDQIQLAYFF